MRILVTGSEGFIGRHLVRELVHAGHSVAVADIKLGNDLRQIGRINRMLRASNADVCVHLAAKVGRLFGETHPLLTVMDNAGMTALVAQACGELGVRMAYASTSEVYGDRGDEWCSEESTAFSFPLPQNAYGLSKRWGEEACELYAPDGLTIWRISMPYGPGLPAGVGRAAIVNMLDQALRGKPIPVHRGAERSWCWIGDTVRALRLTLEETGGGVFNVGRDDEPTLMFDVAKLACDLTGASYDLIYEVDPPARQTVVKRLRTDRIRALGWEPTVSLREGMVLALSAMRELVAV